MNDRTVIPVDDRLLRGEAAADLSGPDWVPCEFRFRGLPEEIAKLRRYLEENQIHITYSAPVPGGADEIRVIADGPVTAGLIARFPALKATGLAENWAPYHGHGVYAMYSESGAPVITEAVYAGEFEGRHECGDGRWEWEYDMMEPVDVRFEWLQSGEEEVVRYRYPFRSRWERDFYMLGSDGKFYRPAAAHAFQICDGVLLRYCGPGGDVVIPDTVTQIDPAGEPFRGDPLITSLYIPATVAHICEYAFQGCVGLKKVTLADGVIGIGDRAFENCSALCDLRLPDTLRSVGSGAFEDCSSLDLETLYIPSGPEFGAFSPFDGCKNVPEVLYTSDRTVLLATAPTVTEVTLPDTVRSIREGAFACRMGLTSVTLPSGLREIGKLAFSNCRSLKYLRLPETLETIGPWAFHGCASLKELRIPGSVRVIPSAMLAECAALETLVLEEGIEEIEAKAFDKCKKLRSVYLPSSLRKKLRGKLFEKAPQLVIRGLPGTPAEAYAREKGFAFQAVAPEGR